MDTGSYRFELGEFQCVSVSDGAFNYPLESFFANVPRERGRGGSPPARPPHRPHHHPVHLPVRRHGPAPGADRYGGGESRRGRADDVPERRPCDDRDGHAAREPGGGGDRAVRPSTRSSSPTPIRIMSAARWMRAGRSCSPTPGMSSRGMSGSSGCPRPRLSVPRPPMVDIARRNLEPMRDRLSLVDDGAEVVPGIRVIATSGTHTRTRCAVHHLGR